MAAAATPAAELELASPVTSIGNRSVPGRWYRYTPERRCERQPGSDPVRADGVGTPERRCDGSRGMRSGA